MALNESPFDTRWRVTMLESTPPRGFTIEATGDLVGCGVWRLRQDGPVIDVVHDWRMRAEKPLLRLFSFVLKPIFAANHRWAMKTVEESLRLELRRPRGEARVPAPPPPTFRKRSRA